MNSKDDVIAELMEGIEQFIADYKYCPLCRSSVHPDGSISHDEDCGVPDGERAMAERRRTK